jgi:RNA polymerase sigma factor (sigma-70 family)
MPSNLNQLYAEYKAAPREMDPDDNGDGKFDPLLNGISSYGLAVARRSGYHSPGDLAQEVTIRAWSNLGKFTGRSSFQTWVRSIAKNYLMDQARQCARQGDPLDLDAIEEEAPAIDEPAPYRNYDALPERMRRIAAGLAAGHTQEYIADRLGVSVKTLRRYIAEHISAQNASKDAALSNFA